MKKDYKSVLRKEEPEQEVTSEGVQDSTPAVAETKSVTCSWCDEEFSTEVGKDFKCPKCGMRYNHRR